MIGGFNRFYLGFLGASCFDGLVFHRKHRISGLVVEYIVAIDVTRVRFPADALFPYTQNGGL